VKHQSNFCLQRVRHARGGAATGVGGVNCCSIKEGQNGVLRGGGGSGGRGGGGKRKIGVVVEDQRAGAGALVRCSAIEVARSGSVHTRVRP
jgi:hypothetical protein